jgi:formylglycine-generating enzyme required for sulfatase activity
VLRGGSWINDDPANLRAANRNHNDPGNRNDNIGFRVVVVGGAFRKAATLFVVQAF